MTRIAVLGAGPAGSVAAIELLRAGHAVTLIDPGTEAQQRIGESLPAAARPLLQRLGLLHLLESKNHLPSFGGISSWGNAEFDVTDSLRDPNGAGWHLDRVRFERDLREQAMRQGAQWLRGSAASISRLVSNRWQVQAQDRTLECDWIVHAAGRSVSVARALGAQRTRDDDLVALCAWYDVSRAKHPQEARHCVESVREGWWYSALLPNQVRVAVLHTDGGTARRLLRAAGSLTQSLGGTRLIARMLEGARPLGPVKTTEASGSRLDRFTGERWIAAGDAAMSFDPLSSQGIFNAVYTGMKAGQTVASAIAGDTTALDRYAEGLERIRAAYLVKRGAYYRAETRFGDAPFWGRRQAARSHR